MPSFFDRRYIYVLGSTRYPFRYKIGIAHNVDSRRQSIRADLRGEVYEVFKVKVFFARRIEAVLHAIYSPLGAHMKGTGKTEWFWMSFPVTPCALLIFFWVVEWTLMPVILACLLYLLRHGFPTHIG